MQSEKGKFNLSFANLPCPVKSLVLTGILFSSLLLPFKGINAQGIENNSKEIVPAESLYDTDWLPASFHQSRRQLLRQKMVDNSVAVFLAAPVRVRSNDVNYKYHQNPDFFYYTGYNFPDALLIIFKTPQTINGVTSDEFIFVGKNNELTETWTGKIPSADEVKAVSAISSVFYNTSFDKTDWKLNDFEKIYFKVPPDINYSSSTTGSTGWLAGKLKQVAETTTAGLDRVSIAKINAELREIKTPEELELMRKAINLTCRGFNEVLKAAKPGMTEYQLQSINEYFWFTGGAEYSGYPSIVGGGHNSCVLHYESNRKKLVAGDILVMDMGAEYHGYTADVTRSFPINGKFSAEQKAIYEIVLKAQEAGIKAALPGNSFNEPHKQATKVIADGLIKLGIIHSEQEVSRYFMHGTSHYLGLDVHDAGTYGPLQPNSVITVEPGIYIKNGSPCDSKWWNIGIRIEDDILITENEPVNLSGCIPKTVQEIESIMAEESLFDRIYDH
ncbi:MAG: aminopeptidase P family protein [Bacteroidia bacterium]|nr:aminopeptidase P family protein [Bacteroidia bacterium]MCZ2277488.1 aminopeptidase P family protein [Bacteroidia bacterium]